MVAAEVTGLDTALSSCLTRHLGPISGPRVFGEACKSAKLEQGTLTPRDVRLLMLELPRLLAGQLTPGAVAKALEDVGQVLSRQKQTAENWTSKPTTVRIETESHIVDARTKALGLAQSIGFHQVDSVKIATVVSELARNIFQYAGSGSIELSEIRGTTRGLQVTARDSGPGIANVTEILSGRYKSRTGMGLGLAGSKRLMSTLEIQSDRGRGTVVTATKYVPQ